MGIYEGSFQVTVYDTDCEDRLKFSSLSNFLQECTRLHADAMGLGFHALEQENRTWMLYRIRMELLRRPASGEQLFINTWSRGTKGLRALRDFTITGSDGKPVGAASSEWLLIDRSSKRPEKPQTRFPELANALGIYPLSRPMGEVIPPEKLWALDERRVRFNEIDFNGHVNNSRYISWIEDTLGRFLVEGREIRCMEIQYLKGAALDDRVNIRGTHSPFCTKVHAEQDIPVSQGGLEQFITFESPAGESSLSLAEASVQWAGDAAGLV